ncbi:hypothetical protein FKM82_024835 [Ascaphus truei]
MIQLTVCGNIRVEAQVRSGLSPFPQYHKFTVSGGSPHFLWETSSMLTLPQTPTTKASISHSLSPRAMRKYPLSPQSVPQELAAS